MSLCRRRRTVLTAVFMVVFVLALWLTAPVAAGQLVTVGGTGCVLGVARLLRNAFEVANPDITVKVLPSLGSGGAIKALSKNALDVGFVARDLTDQEGALGLVGFDLARTPLVIIVNHGVTVSDLTEKQLVDILRGTVQKWPDDERIRPILRSTLESDTLILKSLSTEMATACDVALARPGMLVAMTDQECLQMVGRTPGAVGFSTLAQLLTERGSVRLLGFNGRIPSVEGLRNGDYPLSKGISVLTRAAPSTATKRLLDFMRSPEGGEIIEESGCLLVEPPAGR